MFFQNICWPFLGLATSPNEAHDRHSTLERPSEQQSRQGLGGLVQILQNFLEITNVIVNGSEILDIIAFPNLAIIYSSR